jgi:putative hydrolase of the HAD superfamily
MSDLEASEVELRRAARERALALLYEAEAKGVDVETLLADLPLPPAPLATELVRGVEANRPRIDELLARRVAPRWSMARLAAVDRAILRLATFELLGAPDRSQAVILNEAVVLARRFGTEDSPRFVNGVLSAVAAEVRPQEAACPDAAAPALDGDDLDAEAATDDLLAGGGAGREAAGAPAGAAGGTNGKVRRLVDALVVDLDGVIRHWDESSLTKAEQDLGLPGGTIAAAAFAEPRFGRAMRGELPADRWAREVGTVVAAEHPVDPDAVTDAFATVGWRIDESVVDLVRRVRRRVPVGLLSNASSRLVDDLRLSGILDQFDVVVGSAELGVCKPDRRAFRAVAERLGVPLPRCLFVDDTAGHVAAARDLGMHAVRFTDVDHLATELDAAGLLDPVRPAG